MSGWAGAGAEGLRRRDLGQTDLWTSVAVAVAEVSAAPRVADGGVGELAAAAER